MNRHVNAIAGRLSLRPPQQRSLEILDRITEIVPPKKGTVPLDWRWAPHVGRNMPSFFILEINVVRFIPRRTAVPEAPPITHLVSCRARRM